MVEVVLIVVAFVAGVVLSNIVRGKVAQVDLDIDNKVKAIETEVKNKI